MATKEQWQAEREARATLTMQTLAVTEQSQPTPTQEENDLLRLGLMHPDEKASGGGPAMAPLAAQQVYVESVMNPVEGQSKAVAPDLVKPAADPRRANPRPAQEPITVSRGPGRPPGSTAQRE